MGYTHFEMLQDLEKHGKNLDDYETEFIDSMNKRIGDGKSLTKGQAEFLQKLHEEKV